MLFKYNSFLNFAAALAIFISCTSAKQGRSVNTKHLTITAAVPVDTVKTDEFLKSLLKQYPQYFDSILSHQKDWNVQVIYTQVNRGVNGIPGLQHHYFNVNPARYFYPASTVKLPIVLLALQRLNELKDKGIDKNTTMITETAYSGQTAVYNDPTTATGKPTIAQYIKKILMVSDNDAFNRLYEFLGQEYINAELHKKGYEDVQILHRLDIFLSQEENRQTNPVTFLDSNNNVLYRLAEQRNNEKYVSRTDSIGNGFYRGKDLMNGAMDFSKKNRISLEDLHQILISLVFPNKVRASQRFNITEEDRQFVLKYMSQYPTESVYPPYSADTAGYWPAYCKFLLLGAEKGDQPENMRVFNKSGDAYGHLIDVAYVVDYKNKIEFFLSAIIYCNSDGIMNDDKYDYKTIGLPFMKNLGRVIYEYELKREYKIKPDLSSVTFTYD
ncbi:MAG: serine hydrolase, partial [Ferruginibacter sp.]